jgi:hypothetical protein
MYNAEPTLSSLLEDPLIRTVMSADGVDPVALETMLAGVSRRIDFSPLQIDRASPSCGC